MSILEDQQAAVTSVEFQTLRDEAVTAADAAVAARDAIAVPMIQMATAYVTMVAKVIDLGN